MKVVISHVYSSDNKGDAALVSVLLNDIKRQYPKATVSILTFEDTTAVPTFEGVKQYPSFMNLALTTFSNRIVKLLYSLYIVSATLLWAQANKHLNISLWLPGRVKNTAKIYSEADLIIPVGGGYIRSSHSLTSSINLGLLLHPLIFGKILQKPTVLYTQSVGPFYRSWERRVVPAVLKKLDKVILREDISRELLATLGVTENVVRSVDSGFLFEAKEPIDLRKKLGISKNQLLVGVTVRKWLDPSQQTSYETGMAHIIDYVIDKYDASVVFIPQVTAAFHGDDDRQASQDVFELLDHKDNAYVLTENMTHYDIKAMYDNLDVIIGTRFHSVIFSLTSYVPALAIEYEHKTGGIMRDLGLSEWVIKIEATEPKVLEEKIDALIAERTTYTKHLKKTLPSYIDQARQAIVYVDEAYQEAVRRRKK